MGRKRGVSPPCASGRLTCHRTGSGAGAATDGLRAASPAGPDLGGHETPETISFVTTQDHLKYWMALTPSVLVSLPVLTAPEVPFVCP